MANRELDRRGFFRTGGTLVVGATGAGTATATAAATWPPEADAATRGPSRPPGLTVLPYGRKVIAQAGKLATGVAVPFHFPDDASPCVLIKNDTPVPGGVGPDHRIAAFSTLCPHMGCPTAYDAQARVFRCPCHFSLFDAELGGQMVCGQATVDLPEIVLEYDEKSDTLFAIGVRGLIFGRSANVL